MVLDQLGYVAWWSIYPYFDPHNFFANTVNVWQQYMPAINLLCAPSQATFDLPDYEPFLGANDDWEASLQRFNKRRKG
jgi:hypothetical protein